MKLVAALALAAALASCSPVGPSQAEAQTALADYFATPHTDTVDVAGGELRGARLVRFGDCSAMGQTHSCRAAFEQGGKAIEAGVTIVKRDNGWFVVAVQPR